MVGASLLGDSMDGMILIAEIYCTIVLVLQLIAGLILALVLGYIFGFNDPTVMPIAASIIFLLGCIMYVMMFGYALIVSKWSAVIFVIVVFVAYYFLFNILMPFLFGSNFVAFPLFRVIDKSLIEYLI